MWIKDIRSQIPKIKQSSYYEGDFGDTISDRSLLLNEITSNNTEHLNDYYEFMQSIGFGELDASFYMEDGPTHYQKLFDREIIDLKGMYIFASDQSEYSYAFDSKNNFEVVDISASGILGKNHGCFKTFIMKKITEVENMTIWREENL